MKATAVAPSNLAFVKYWGKKDGILRLPSNASISMNLSNLLTTTTVEFFPDWAEDQIEIGGVKHANNSKQAQRVIRHLDRIRKSGGITEHAKVVSENNFPSGTGLSSSASGFAALTVAAATAANLRLSEKELSILARKGSGSSCRSIPDGFVEWVDGDSDENSFAFSLFPASHWDIADVVAVISQHQKDIGTTEGQESATTSPFFQARLIHIGDKLKTIKELLDQKDFQRFGEIIEAEALELHAIMLTSSPALIYWQPETIRMMKLIIKWRVEGLPVYFSLNTGQDIHIVCEKKSVAELVSLLKNVPEVMKVIINYPALGAKVISNHLF